MGRPQIPSAPIRDPLQLRDGLITSPSWIAWFERVVSPTLQVIADIAFDPAALLSLSRPLVQQDTSSDLSMPMFPASAHDGSGAGMPPVIPVSAADTTLMPPVIPVVPEAPMFPPSTPQTQLPWVLADTLANQAKYPVGSYPVGTLFVASDKQLIYENSGAAWVQTPNVPASAELLKSNSDKQIIAAALTSGKVWIGDGSNLPAQQTISGDATLANTGALTLANSGVTAGTYGSVSNIPVFSVDAKGRVTAAVNQPLGGISATVSLAKLTLAGTNGSITFTNGIATAKVDPT